MSSSQKFFVISFPCFATLWVKVNLDFLQRRVDLKA